ncbi:hypothetical protein XENTR_v10015033 [Xenopus tropicalis]|uniref:WD repeat and coiled-coil-containing protein n=1 Tax=Xenopus tropicalis TaxID=8364 RepID=A0A6I8S3W0_XENTR|nr:WD repeat and coiled-coil-containing protein [Xenopus tropicalis]KAE8605226.1 hypothetical protein XENTR_v10015033 [Xenopus tropicalis]
MDLGKAKLLRDGLNALHQAIHPVYGLAWTDGRQVVLTAIEAAECDEPTFGNSVIIGHFEHVYGLYWGPVSETNAPALLAVQHKKHVTIWQLYYSPQEKNKLVVVQSCEVGDPCPVLAQGCVWHPSKDIILILTKRDLTLLYAPRYENSSVKADIKGIGAICCACWTKEGSRVVVAVDSALYSYIWDDAQKTLNPCSFCPVFDIDAKIYAIQPITRNHVAATTEMPSADGYGNKDIISEVPTLQSSLLALDSELARKNRRMSVESGKSEPVALLRVSSLASADLPHILARHRKSDPSPLAHLRHNNFTARNKISSSRLVIVSFDNNSTTTRKVSIPGILMPDILVLDANSQRVAVSSNMCNLVVICPIAPSCMPNVQQIKFEEIEQVKGVCFLTDRSLLVLVGKQRSNDAVLMPLSSSEKYLIYLTTKELMPIEYVSSSMVDGSTGVPAMRNKDFYDEHILNKELLMPSNIGIQSPMVRRRLTRSLRSISRDPSPTSSLSDMDDNRMATDSFVSLENLDAEPRNNKEISMDQGRRRSKLQRLVAKELCENYSGESLHLLANNTEGYNKGEDVSITRNLGNHESGLWDPHCCLSVVKELLKNCMKSQPYPSLEDPHYLFITYQDPVHEGVSEKRSVLLSHGKLHLRAVQDVFQLTSIEMKFGSMWIILTEDGEGFVPITFKHNQEVTIRDARERGHSRSSTCCADSIVSLGPSGNMPQCG